MQTNNQKEKSSKANHSTSETLNKKQKIDIIHKNASIDILKKMFIRTKNKSQHIPFQQSLLFDRNNSLAMLKAYRNRKKILLQDGKNKQFSIDKYTNNKSTIDSPQKIQLCLNSKKFQIDKNDLSKQLYDQIIKKIQTSSKDNNNKLPFISSKKPKRIVKSTNQNVNWEKYTLPNLNQKVQDESPNYQQQINRAASRTIEPNYTNQPNKNQFYRIKNFKNFKNITQGNKLLLMKAQIRQSMQNPQIMIDFQSQEQPQKFGAMSEIKIKKQIINPPETQNILSELPQLKVVKSAKSLIVQQNKFHKGYMHFHLQAKAYLKQHKQKLNQPAKIKDFLISGITATSFAVIDLQTMTLIAAKNFNKRIQIASISKIMTCYLTLLACKKYQIDPKKKLVRITLQASQMNGTSAGLQIGDCLTLQDLLYALMLPSGNDAAVAIAQTIGKIIQRYKTKETKKNYHQTFIAHMNLLSRQLKLQQDWKNSHGLPLHPNHSTPHAICLLTIAAMMDQKFKQIVNCKQYQVSIKNQRTGLKKICKWKNTNKLLFEGWEGVKTGTTDSAGHCLMAKKQRYLIAVFDSKTLSKRFTECQQLYELVKSKQRYLFPQKWD